MKRFLALPIVLLVIYSFNASESVALWGGFSLRWYTAAWENTQVQEATVRSLVIAVSAALISTTVATMAPNSGLVSRRVTGLTCRTRSSAVLVGAVSVVTGDLPPSRLDDKGWGPLVRAPILQRWMISGAPPPRL